MKGNLFSEKSLIKIQKIRKVFLLIAVWILIAELAFGIVLILIGQWNSAIAKVQATFLVLALALFISVNNFIRIEKGGKIIQSAAMVSFISNILWVIFALLLMWEVVPTTWTEEVRKTGGVMGRTYLATIYHLTVYAKILLISACTAASGFWISNILSIEETAKPVKPLKITAALCSIYLWVFEIVLAITELEYDKAEKAYQLSFLVAPAFLILALAAVIVSRTSKKRLAKSAAGANGATAQSIPKTDDELRAEIEEKVRREMIEKEVRAKIEIEQAGVKQNDATNSAGDDIQNGFNDSFGDVVNDRADSSASDFKNNEVGDIAEASIVNAEVNNNPEANTVNANVNNNPEADNINDNVNSVDVNNGDGINVTTTLNQ